MKIPYLNLKKINKTVFINHKNKLLGEIKKGKYILNSDINKFENKFAKYCKSKFCITLNSGHDALKVALLSLGVKNKDKVVVPSQTFISTWFAVNEIGADLIPVDIDIKTGLIDNTKLLNLIKKENIKCVIFVHLFGNICDIFQVKKALKKKNIKIIEDCSQSHGGYLKKKHSGTLGDVGTFSFYPGKNLGGIGDGGAIITNSKEIRDKSLKLRNYGSNKKYHHDILGFNSRLNPFNANFLYYKINYLNSEINLRKKQILLYKKIFNKNKINFKYMVINKNAKSSNHIFYIRTKLRDKLKAYLNKRKIETLIHYPIIPPLQKLYFKKFFKKNNSYTYAKKLSEESLSLPIGSHLSLNNISHIANNVCRFFRNIEKINL